MLRNINLEWSGTLVDDLPAVWQATNHVSRQAGIAEMSLEQFRAEFCLPFAQFYARYTPRVPMAQLEHWVTLQEALGLKLNQPTRTLIEAVLASRRK